MSVEKKLRMQSWSDLPPDLLSRIADRLGLIELVRFRSYCKAWNSASSAASAKIESALDFKPWFLLYGTGDEKMDSGQQCKLVADCGTKFNMSLPELDGATCLASHQGWLLLFKEGQHGSNSSMFFFRPFSETKIDLPESPISKVSDHVAAFSCHPISQDCTVCVTGRINDDELEVNVLRRGANKWVQVNIRSTRAMISTIECNAYRTRKQGFYFLDGKDGLLVVPISKSTVSPEVSSVTDATHTTSKAEIFSTYKKYFKSTNMKETLRMFQFLLVGHKRKKMATTHSFIMRPFLVNAKAPNTKGYGSTPSFIKSVQKIRVGNLIPVLHDDHFFLEWITFFVSSSRCALSV